MEGEYRDLGALPSALDAPPVVGTCRARSRDLGATSRQAKAPELRRFFAILRRQATPDGA